MANKDFKVKNGLDIQTPLPVSMGGTGQTSTTNTLNSLLPAQSGNANKVLQTDGTNTTWATPVKGLNSGTAAQRPGSPSNGDLYFNTDDMQIEVYQNGNWLIANITPGIPTGVTATNQGSGRAFNNGQASVSFTAATTGGPVKNFTVTPSPSTSPSTFTGTSSPISVTGLASSTQYTYTVTASSNIGTSSASSASSGVTATTVPQAPTIGTASVSGVSGTASVTFTTNATGGSAITSYTVTSSPGSITASGASSPITVTGLTNGTAYTFTVTATNANGTSSASSASNSVTPTDYVLSTSYEPIAVATVPAGGLSSITFGNIPQTYTHLQIRTVARCNHAGNGRNITLRFNQDTGNSYTDHYLYADGSNVTSGGSGVSNFAYLGFAAGQGIGTTAFGQSIIDILDYSNTNKNKTLKSLQGYDGNGNGLIILRSCLWTNTNAISSIIFALEGGTATFNQYSQIALYGVKGS